jgi:hypothetical protein
MNSALRTPPSALSRMPYNDLPRLETGVGVANARNPLQCAAAARILSGLDPIFRVERVGVRLSTLDPRLSTP